MTKYQLYQENKGQYDNSHIRLMQLSTEFEQMIHFITTLIYDYLQENLPEKII